MKRHLLFATIWSCALGASAQPAQISGPVYGHQAGREKREIRDAVKNQGIAPTVHLSQRERAEMREQLGGKRPDAQTYPATDRPR